MCVVLIDKHEEICVAVAHIPPPNSGLYKTELASFLFNHKTFKQSLFKFYEKIPNYFPVVPFGVTKSWTQLSD